MRLIEQAVPHLVEVLVVLLDEGTLEVVLFTRTTCAVPASKVANSFPMDRTMGAWIRENGWRGSGEGVADGDVLPRIQRL